MNTVFFVVVRSPQWYAQRGRSYRAVVARRITEWWVKWSVAFVLSAPSLLLEAYPLQWMISLGALLLASLWVYIPRDRMELLGAAVEVLVDGRPGRLQAEADRIVKEMRSKSAHRTRAQTECLISQRLNTAGVLVRLLRRRIETVPCM